MNRPAWEGEVIAKLPFQIRPIAGEGGRSFIARLAQANHLPPAYLRKFLVEPPWGPGPLSWNRLAEVSGRDPQLLRKILDTAKCKECGTSIPPKAPFGRPPFLCSSRCRSWAHRRTLTTVACRVCQQPMVLRLGQRQRLCSSACRRAAYLARWYGQPDNTQAGHVGPQPGEQSRACIVCENPIPEFSNTTWETCSASCSNEARRWHQLAQREQPPLPMTACGFCGKPIPSSTHPRGPVRKWCSGRCSKRAQRGLDPADYGPVTCEHCQKLFVRGPSGRVRRWCSLQCQQVATERTVRAVVP